MAKKGVPFKPTAAMRRRVSIGAAAGMTHEEIALALGISKPTLYKFFEVDLGEGASRRRLEVVEALMKAAVGEGSVAAAKALLGLPVRPAVPPAAAGETATMHDKARAPELGKKEQAALDAVNAPLQDPGWAELLTRRRPLQ